MAAFTFNVDKFNTGNAGTDGYADVNNTAANVTGVVGADAYVFGSDDGLALSGTGGWTLTINGGIFGAGSDGIELAQASATLLSTVTVAATGDVYGFTNGIRTNHATSITNNAVIGGENGSAIFQTVTSGTKAFTITNSLTGQILSGAGYGIEIYGSVAAASAATATRTIANAGLLAGALGAINTATDGVTNFDGKDIVTNSGTLGFGPDLIDFGTGNVELGLGNDSFTNSGFVWGDVDVGAGDNIVANSKTIAGGITGGSGNDSVSSTTATSIIGGNLVLGAGNNTVANSGTLGNTIGQDDSITAGSGNDTITNTGTASLIAGDLVLGDGVNIVTNAGSIGSLVFDAAGITGGSGNDTINNTGTITGDISLSDGTNSVSNTKTIDGFITGGIGNDTVTNTAPGVITDYVNLGTGALNKLTNSGKIEGSNGGVTVSSTGDKFEFANSGTIAAAVVLSSLSTSANLFSNTGTIGGDVTISGNGTNTVTNSGTLGDGLDSDDALTLGSGNDAVNGTGGTFKGNITLGDGVNTLTVSKSVTGFITGGTGNDTISNTTPGIITGDVDLGTDGTNTLTNSGTLGDAMGFAVLGGNGTVVKNLAVVVSTGLDTVTNSGTIHGVIDLGSGNDTLNNTGTINGSVDLGSALSSRGADAPTAVNVLTNSKLITGDIIGGLGNDTITNTAGTINGNVNLGAGALNTVTNGGKITGDVIIAGINPGTLATIDTTPGDRYVFSNTGTILGEVSLNETLASIGTKLAPNAGTFTNSGTIGALNSVSATNVFLSDGKDIVNNTGTVYGAFFLGGGADSFTGGASNDFVQAGEGADIINLGADKYNALLTPDEAGDVYFAGGAVSSAADGLDIIDGGAGVADAYVAGSVDAKGDLTSAANNVFINLDNTLNSSKTDTGFIWSTNKSIASETAYGLDVSGDDTGDATKKDTVKGFEWAAGGNGNDLIFGTAGSNWLFGNLNDASADSDILYGLAGNDYLFGGGGDDFIVGGVGRDILFGGSDELADTGTDFFAYGSVADSTVLAAGRDKIMDYDLGSDVIDLSQIGTNIKFIGNNVAFASTAGQMRAIWTALTTIVQLDTNGDNKADFAIEIDGRHNLSAGNFILGGSIDLAGINMFDGTAGNDSHFGAGGDDIINGADGNDTLQGGAGVDTIHGNNQNDTISGGADADQLFGDAGDDIIIGGGGDDTIEGGTNNDTASYATALADNIIFDNGDGSIKITGSEGVDTVSQVEFLQFGSSLYSLQLGSAGKDTMIGTAGKDIVLAGAEDDSILGTAGDDLIEGGTDGVSGDTLSFELITSSVNVNLVTGLASGTGIGKDIISGIENVTGGTAADIITGTEFANTLIGGGGVDTINAGLESDSINAGDGADIVDLGGVAGLGDAAIDYFQYVNNSEFGDTVTNFDIASDQIEFAGALKIEYNDGSGAAGSLQFHEGNNAEGGQETVALADFEAVLLRGSAGEGLTSINIQSALALRNELNDEFIFTTSGANKDALIVVNSTNSNEFSVWQFVDDGSTSAVTTEELTLIGYFNGDGDVTKDAFILA